MKNKIIEAAVLVALRIGYMNVTYKDVGAELNVVASHVQYYFPSIKRLRDAIVQYAVANNSVPILAQALSLGHEAVRNLDKVSRGEVARYIKGV